MRRVLAILLLALSLGLGGCGIMSGAAPNLVIVGVGGDVVLQPDPTVR